MDPGHAQALHSNGMGAGGDAGGRSRWGTATWATWARGQEEGGCCVAMYVRVCTLPACVWMAPWRRSEAGFCIVRGGLIEGSIIASSARRATRLERVHELCMDVQRYCCTLIVSLFFVD